MLAAKMLTTLATDIVGAMTAEADDRIAGALEIAFVGAIVVDTDCSTAGKA